MRLAYLTGEYPRATDTFVQREVAALRAMGATVHTFAARRPSDHEIVGAEQHAERNSTSYLVPPRPGETLAAHVACLCRAPRRYLGALRLAWQTAPAGLRNLGYQLLYFGEAVVLARRLRLLDVEHLHNHFANSSCTVAMLVAHVTNLPFSFTLHGPAIFFEPHRWRIDEKMRRARFVACISLYCRSQAMIFAAPEVWPRLHVVHCGIEPDRYMPVQHEGQGSRLLFVGRLARVKGLPVLFEAMRQLVRHRPEVRLTLVGNGADRNVLERQAIEMGLAEHVRFAGYRSQAEVRDLLRQADVFVLPSFAEGVPVVLMEAMATGVPVVSTRIGGVAELVTDGGSGYLIPPGDAAALTERVAELLGDAALRQRMGEAGRAMVKRSFNLSIEAKHLHELFLAAGATHVPEYDGAHSAVANASFFPRPTV